MLSSVWYVPIMLIVKMCYLTQCVRHFNVHVLQVSLDQVYCKFGNFREKFTFVNSVKRHICDVKNRDLGMNYRQNDFAISRGFIFMKLRICEVLRK